MAGLASVGLKFIVSSVSKEFETDCFMNVVKRREDLSFRTSVGLSSANVGFVSGDPLGPSNSLSISDRSTALAGNRPRESNYTSLNAISFEISTEEFLLTNVFTDEERTIQPLPLFFKHTLNTTNLPSGAELMSVKILNHLLLEQEVAELKVDLTNGIIYNNLVNSYDSATEWTVYYVRYKVKNGTRIDTFTDLLDNVTQFQVAEFEDLGTDMKLLPTAEAYLIEESLDGFTVTLPALADYAFKSLAESRLRVVKPTTTSLSDPWFVRVSNGKFFSRVGGTLYKYRVAEFLSQSFFPEAPIKISRDELAAPITRSLIKTDYEALTEDSSLDMYVDVQIANVSGVALAAYTTNSINEGETAENGKVYEYWNKTDRAGIRSIDHETGFIDVEGILLKETDKVTCTYYYEERHYEFASIDFNPISNRQILDSTLVLFIDPEAAGETKTQTLYYLLLDQTGRCLASNWPDYDNDTQLLTNGSVLFYELVPPYLTSPPTNEIFIDDYTVEVSGVFLVLADVTVDEGSHIDDLILIDSRRRGGGIRDDRYEEALVLNPELVWNWDQGNWDGVPYRGTATYMVEVPVNVLDGAGGTFRTNQVTDVVERHTAFGVYPITKAYGPDIQVSGITPAATSISFSWSSHGFDIDEDLKYNIYKGISVTGPWDLVSGSPVDHSVSGHDFTISGLIPNTIYFFTIVPGYVGDDSELVPLVHHYSKWSNGGK